MKWKCSDLKCVRKPTKSRLSLTPCKQIQPLSRVKSIDGPRIHGISLVGKERVYGVKDLLKNQVLSSEWNTEWVREDASGDSEDGDDDELPCVIGGSAGDCVWRGFRRSVGSLFRRQDVSRYHGMSRICQRRWGVACKTLLDFIGLPAAWIRTDSSSTRKRRNMVGSERWLIVFPDVV